MGAFVLITQATVRSGSDRDVPTLYAKTTALVRSAGEMSSFEVLELRMRCQKGRVDPQSGIGIQLPGPISICWVTVGA